MLYFGTCLLACRLPDAHCLVLLPARMLPLTISSEPIGTLTIAASLKLQASMPHDFLTLLLEAIDILMVCRFNFKSLEMKESVVHALQNPKIS